MTEAVCVRQGRATQTAFAPSASRLGLRTSTDFAAIGSADFRQGFHLERVREQIDRPRCLSLPERVQRLETLRDDAEADRVGAREFRPVDELLTDTRDEGKDGSPVRPACDDRAADGCGLRHTGELLAPEAMSPRSITTYTNREAIVGGQSVCSDATDYGVSLLRADLVHRAECRADLHTRHTFDAEQVARRRNQDFDVTEHQRAEQSQFHIIDGSVVIELPDVQDLLLLLPHVDDDFMHRVVCTGHSHWYYPPLWFPSELSRTVIDHGQ